MGKVKMVGHMSDCSMRNRPAEPLKECDCGFGMTKEDWRLLVKDSFDDGFDQGHEEGYGEALDERNS